MGGEDDACQAQLLCLDACTLYHPVEVYWLPEAEAHFPVFFEIGYLIIWIAALKHDAH